MVWGPITLCYVLWKIKSMIMGCGFQCYSLDFSNIFLSDIDSPKNLVTDQVTENTLSVSWDPVQANIDRYIVSYTSADGDTREVPVSKEKTSTVLTGLKPGMEYKVHVWAQKGTQESRKANTKAPTGDWALIASVLFLSS